MTGMAIGSARGPGLDDEQLIAWLRLLRTDGIGPKTFQSLINQFGSAAAAVAALPELSLRRTGRRVEVVSREIAERELSTARRFGARFVARGQGDYPKALAEIDSAPPLIAVVGTLPLEPEPKVAIVGSRNASLPGLKMAEKLAVGLGREGYVIASGLARGVDARAHAAALPTGTIAVLAGGLDRLYPEENRRLFDDIVARGAVISEMPFGWEPRGRDFPRRNRIVSGLCLGVVIVEANQKSGSLITARFGLEQNRSIFAVPGSPLDPRAEGPNGLIRQGATLVTSADDIHQELKRQREPMAAQMSMLDAETPRESPLWDEADWLGAGAEAAVGPADPPVGGWHDDGRASLRDRILMLLATAPSDPDDIARALETAAREVQIALFDLESEGLVERRAGGGVARRPV
jgi:DNA processing protein